MPGVIPEKGALAPEMLQATRPVALLRRPWPTEGEVQAEVVT